MMKIRGLKLKKKINVWERKRQKKQKKKEEAKLEGRLSP